MKVSIPQDLKWKQERQACLEKYFYHNWNEESYSSQHKKALETWYMEGDLAPLLESKDADIKYSLDLETIMSYCPADSTEEYFRIMQTVSLWLSERNLDYWDNSLIQENRYERFFGSFVTSEFVSNNLLSSPDLTLEIIKVLYARPGDSHMVFPYSLGKDNWVPEWSIDLPSFVRRTLTTFRSYLFAEEERSKENSMVVGLLDYIVPELHTIDEHVFGLALSDDSSVKAGQRMIRRFLCNLHGYQTVDEKAELQHNDSEIEQALRDAFEQTDMPDSYHKLIEFIHEHKEYAIDPDYKETSDNGFY